MQGHSLRRRLAGVAACAASACLPHGGRQDRRNATSAEQQAEERDYVAGYFPEVTGVVVAYRASRLVAWIRLPDRPSRASAVLRVNAPLREGGPGFPPRGLAGLGPRMGPQRLSGNQFGHTPRGHGYLGGMAGTAKNKRARLGNDSPAD